MQLHRIREGEDDRPAGRAPRPAGAGPSAPGEGAGARSARSVGGFRSARVVGGLAALVCCLQACHGVPAPPDHLRGAPTGPFLGFAAPPLPLAGRGAGGICPGRPAGGGFACRGGSLPGGKRAMRPRGVFGIAMQAKPGGEEEDEDKETKQAQSGTALFAKKADGEEASGKTPLTAWFTVALLLGLNVHNQWTRALVYYLVSFKVEDSEEASKLYMNKDLGFGEEQYSLLASFGFTTLYTAASLVAGRAADKFNRANVITLAAALWSVSTAATALSASFESVLGLRAVQGVTQAFVGPQAYGLIASSFSGTGASMATANSIYASGVYVGGALASLSIILDEKLGWRETSLAAGAVGLGLAAIGGLTLKDPRTVPPEALPAPGAGAEASQGGGFDVSGTVDALKTVLSNRFVQVLFVATAFRFCAGYGIGVWKAPFYREAFPTFTSEFSVANAFVISGGGILSSLLGGTISDRLSPKDQRWQLWVPAAGCLLAVPFWIGTVKADNFYMSIGMLFLEYIAAECWFGPVVASLYKAVPKEVQGSAQGLFTVLTAVGNVMPVLIGSMQKEYPISDVLAVTVSAAYVLAGAFFFLASTQMPQKQAEGKQ